MFSESTRRYGLLQIKLAEPVKLEVIGRWTLTRVLDNIETELVEKFVNLWQSIIEDGKFEHIR